MSVREKNGSSPHHHSADLLVIVQACVLQRHLLKKTLDSSGTTAPLAEEKQVRSNQMRGRNGSAIPFPPRSDSKPNFSPKEHPKISPIT
jgi:hypothetical protein